jgi:hypothetical protein
VTVAAAVAVTANKQAHVNMTYIQNDFNETFYVKYQGVACEKRLGI